MANRCDLSQGFTQQQVAKYVLDAAIDGIKDGDVKTYFYALFNDGSGQFGLMNQDGTPTPAGTALHDLTTLFTDTGANASTFTATSLNYTISGTISGDNSLLFEKSDGSYWLSLWNEDETAGSPHNVTLNLPGSSEVKVFDPLTGTTAISDVTGVTSVTISVPDHPVLVEILPAAPTPAPTPVPTPTPTPIATPTPPPAPTATSANDLAVSLPALSTVAAGSTTATRAIPSTPALGRTRFRTAGRATRSFYRAGMVGLMTCTATCCGTAISWTSVRR